MKTTKKAGFLERFAGSRIENDQLIRAGASDIASHMQEPTYVGKNGDIRHTCDTTTSDEVYIGYSFPKD